MTGDQYTGDWIACYHTLCCTLDSTTRSPHTGSDCPREARGGTLGMETREYNPDVKKWWCEKGNPLLKLYPVLGVLVLNEN